MTSTKVLLASAAAIGCAIAFASPASAQQSSGPYVSLGAGPQWLQDAHTTSSAGTDTKIQFDTGFAVVGAGGYALGNGFRFEGELGVRHNDIKGASTGSASGTIRSLALMANGLYDISLGWPVTPYVGAGIGAAEVHPNGSLANAGGVDDQAWRFAYQGIAGLAYPLTDGLKLDVSYRYFSTLDPAFNSSSGSHVDSEYHDHTLLFALRWEFGAPKPAPTPVAAPAPAPAPAPPPAPAARQIQRSYLVFFDFDKSDITPEASRVIQQAATNAKQGNVTRIQATGHADRAGSDRYNMALSIRRANAVKAALVAQGIRENEIVVIGKGETEPLVPTPDGVREPQNRRVEILLQ